MRSRPWLNRLLMPAAVLLFYSLVPVGDGGTPFGQAIGMLVAVASVVAVAYVVASEVRRSERRLQPVHLILALELVLVGFALAYYVLAVNHPASSSG